MKSIFKILLPLCVALITASCAHPKYLTPDIKKSYLTNTGTFVVQNMDNKGKIEPQSLTAHYDGFDVRYKISDAKLVSFEIINNTNKSLIIDKSKCYVLYNGYSTELFKDVRSSRSTTFNNVQDAINNVQTSDASITMTIPPYSKWSLPLNETNLRSFELPAFIEDLGVHSISQYDNPETVEFVIPYTFDYSLTKWNTSRNRVYVGHIKVSNEMLPVSQNKLMLNDNNYQFCRKILYINKEEIDNVNRENIEIWKRHRRAVNTSHIFWGIVTSPTVVFPLFIYAYNLSCKRYWEYVKDYGHRPKIYNSDGTYTYYKKNLNEKAKY